MRPETRKLFIAVRKEDYDKANPKSNPFERAFYRALLNAGFSDVDVAHLGADEAGFQSGDTFWECKFSRMQSAKISEFIIQRVTVPQTMLLEFKPV